MRITYLKLPSFKNLKNFEICFAPNEPDVLVVGRNGTGKSNLIEALVIIFRDLISRLDKQSPQTPFSYIVHYSIAGHTVEIDHDPARSKLRTRVVVDGTPCSIANLRPAAGPELVPRTVFAYYSGPSDRLSSLFDTSLADFRGSMIAGDTAAQQRLVYGRLIHSRFVLLAFLAEDDEASTRVLRKELGIEKLESAMFVLQQPYWAKAQTAASKADFWKARGVVRDFLKSLYDQALAPLQLEVRERTGINQKSRRQRLHLFLDDPEKLKKVIEALSPAEGEPPARTLFRVLESAFVSDLISDVAVRIRKTEAEGEITFRELSEGEQQLLMVLGLLRFTRNEESLFLLDEPDTHLNPVWGLKFLELVEKVVGTDASRHLIFATHDPVAVAMVRKTQLRLLSKNEDGSTRSLEPLDDPIKLGIAGVLTSEIFGLRSTMAPEIADKIERKHELMARGNERSIDEAREFTSLDRELNEVDLSAGHPDPLYAEFVKRLLQRENQVLRTQDSFSPEEIRTRDALMDEIIDEIFGEKQ
jgi:predicted ATPase